MTAKHEDIIGRSVYITLGGREYRVYYEEVGQGIPFILCHTAGSDGRVYRRLLNDKDVISNFRCIVYDLPYHGKSLPPLGVEWWAEEYNMTGETMMGFPNAFCEALELDRPVYMGMSAGGHLAIDLALYYPEKYRATIGVEGALCSSEEYRKNGMKAVRWEFDNPMINTSEMAAAMLLNMSPTSPEENVREVMWQFMQSAPGVFAGDLLYYYVDHYITPEQAASIDTSKCMLYLLTGEYDPNTSPADTQKVADLVKGCYFKAMKNLGHFPIVENYPAFKEYLMPILDDILAKNK